MALSSKDKTRLYHDLGTLLKSGFHLDRGIDLLLGQNPSAGRRAWLEGLRQGLSEGRSVAGSLEYRPSGSSELEIGLLAAGERGGRLDEACAELVKYFAVRHQSASKALGALVYPLILVHFAIVVPDFSKVINGGLSAGFAGIPLRLAVLWSLIAVAAAVALLWSRAAASSVAADRLLRRMPLVGSVRRHWALARFSQVMHTSLLAALKMSEALRLAGGASRSAVLNEGARNAAQKIETGENFSNSLRSAGGFSFEFNNSMEMAEHAGTLDHEFGRWALAEAQLAARAQDRVAEWLPRIFYVLVVLYVASRIVGMFSGYYSILGGLADDLEKAQHNW